RTAGCVVTPCTEPVRRGDDIPLIPKHRVNAGLDYHVLPWLTLSLTGAYVGEQRLRGDEENVEAPLKGYVVVNAGMRARWKDLTASLWVFNLLNDAHETFGTFAPNAKLPGDPVQRFTTPAPPISVQAGLSYRF